MSDIIELLDDATADAENFHGDPGNISGQRRAGAATAAVLAVRLTADQLKDLSARAEAAGQPASAYARSILLDSLSNSERVGS